MAERAAHLVDHVFPDAPVRQWVLSLPYRLRYRLAWDHDLCRAVVAVFVRAVLGCLRARARGDGLPRWARRRGGRDSAVRGRTDSQPPRPRPRVGWGLREGPCRRADLSPRRPRLTALDVAEVLATVEPRIKRLLDWRGLGDGDDDAAAPSDVWADESPGWPGWPRPPCRGPWRGRPPGARIRRLVGPPAEDGRGAEPGGCHARWNGFDFHAGSGGAGRPAGAARAGVPLCSCGRRCRRRSARVTGDGQVLLQFRQPVGRWHGAPGCLPGLNSGRLAVLVPLPRITLSSTTAPGAPSGLAIRDCSARDLGSGWRGRPGRAPGGQAVPADARARRQVRGQRWADSTRRTLRCGRAGLSALRRPPALDRADRGGRRHRPDPPTSRPADDDPRGASRASAAASCGGSDAAGGTKRPRRSTPVPDRA